MQAIENVVRSILREAGIKLGTPSRAAFAVRELIGADTVVVTLVEPLLAIMATTLREFGRLIKQVLNIACKEQVRRRLMIVPGVGAT